MEKEVNKEKNSKKLFVGTYIMFCIVILILGMTFAYFTQSNTKNIDSLATADIKDTLKYTDNKDYMRQELIPAKVDIAKQAYALEGTNKCIDINGHSACSVYRFNIKNIANVSQELIIDMAPTINGFANLYYIIFEIDKEGNSTEIISSKKIEELTEEMIQKNNISSYNLIKGLTLNPNSDKTYEIVFFVNDTGEDQTVEDAGKSFGATIKISSVTTGKYMVESFGENCWETELLSNGTYKLTEFYGIGNDVVLDYENGNIIYGEEHGKINQSCIGYINDDDEDGYYSVYVPSAVGEKQITTLGNELFFGFGIDENNDILIPNIYSKINNIEVSEGIEIIEDGDYNNNRGAFSGLGIEFINYDFSFHDVNISLPSTLIDIGTVSFANSYLGDVIFNKTNNISNLKAIKKGSFFGSRLKSIVIPKEVIEIEDEAFSNMSGVLYLKEYVETMKQLGVSSIIFEGAENEKSQLKIIGKSAFETERYEFSNVTSLKIPASVEIIGEAAFKGQGKLETIEFVGTEEGTSNLKIIGDYAFFAYDGSHVSKSLKSIKIPASVQTIGDFAFGRNQGLSKLEFFKCNDGTSSLKTIGDYGFSTCDLTKLELPEGLEEIGVSAFGGNNLTYTDPLNPLIIPSSVIKMGNSAFSSSITDSYNNPYLNYIRFNGTLIEGNSDWYRHKDNGGATELVP